MPLTACNGGGKDAAPTTTTASTTTSSIPTHTQLAVGGCEPTPPAGPTLSWVPADLPLPFGSYPVRELTSGPGTHQAIFVVPGTLVDFVKFAAAEWHKAGWSQGRGEAEQGEAENTFARLAASGGADPNRREGGAWRVRQPFCDQGKAELLLVFVQK